jgi:ubiquinone/menaquinone biosynthesis C-methylase UbiE
MTYAEAWASWFPMIERAAEPLTERMLALARLRPGNRVLDVGTGIGGPALSAARLVGSDGEVLAIDPDGDMIDTARKRAADSGLQNVSFAVQGAEAVTLQRASIDAVLSRWSLMFVDHVSTTLNSLSNLLRPEGRIVIATWDRPEHVPALSLAKAVIHTTLGRELPRFGPKTAFALSDISALSTELRAAGFAGIVQEPVSLTYEFRSIAQYLQFRTDCTGSLFSNVGEVSPAERDLALQAVAKALDWYRGEDGVYRLVNRAWCTAAARDGG